MPDVCLSLRIINPRLEPSAYGTSCGRLKPADIISHDISISRILTPGASTWERNLSLCERIYQISPPLTWENESSQHSRITTLLGENSMSDNAEVRAMIWCLLHWLTYSVPWENLYMSCQSLLLWHLQYPLCYLFHSSDIGHKNWSIPGEDEFQLQSQSTVSFLPYLDARGEASCWSFFILFHLRSKAWLNLQKAEEGTSRSRIFL